VTDRGAAVLFGALAPLRRLVDVRPGEPRLALLAGAYFYFLLASYFILRPIRESLAGAAGFYLIDGKAPEALAALRVLYGASGDPWAGLHAALLAPDDATRDEALAAVLAKRNPPDPEAAARPWLVEFAQWLKDTWAAGGDKALDLKAVDKITARCVARPADAANIDYLTARFLQKHGREDDGSPTAAENESLNNISEVLDASPDSLVAEDAALGNGEAGATGELPVVANEVVNDAAANGQ
jgi:hypothetical protein